MRATTLLANLITLSPFYMSHAIDLSTFVWWLSNDYPDLFRELHREGATTYFSRRLGRYLSIAQAILRIANGRSTDGPNAFNSASGRPATTDELDNLLELAFPNWILDARRDAVDDARLLCGALGNEIPLRRKVIKVQTVSRWHIQTTTCPALQLARDQVLSCSDTGFIVPTSALTDDFSQLIDETHCLVVPLKATSDESWRLHSSDGAIRFDHLAFTSDAGNELRTMLSLDEGRVMFDFESLLESFHRFRAELPILYVAKRSSVLVTYPIQPFALRDRFYSERAHFESSWEGCSKNFQARLDDLDRDRLPNHYYVCRNVVALPGVGAGMTAMPQALPHWTLPS
jgi:hypothetical protein